MPSDEPPSGSTHSLLQFDARSSFHLKEAAHVGGCSPDSVKRWSSKAGIAAQLGGRHGVWRVHKAGWLALLADDEAALRDLRGNVLSPRLQSYFAKAGIVVPESQGVAA